MHVVSARGESYVEEVTQRQSNRDILTNCAVRVTRETRHGKMVNLFVTKVMNLTVPKMVMKRPVGVTRTASLQGRGSRFRPKSIVNMNSLLTGKFSVAYGEDIVTRSFSTVDVELDKYGS